MENATKALLIVAAILIIIMLISTMLIFRDKLAGYFSEKHDSKMVEQLIEFNNKFQNYSGQTIRGNELISVMNMIIDYNNYQAEIQGYERISIEINFISEQYTKELKYKNETGSDSIFTFSNNIIKNKPNSDQDISTISGLPSTLASEIKGLTDTKLQKMSAQIANIVDDDIVDSRARDEYEEHRAELLKRILGYEVNNSDISAIKTATYKYYQYTQFKRAMFKCTNVLHNETNGRVKGMEFEVVLEEDFSGNRKIKFD